MCRVLLIHTTLTYTNRICLRKKKGGKRREEITGDSSGNGMMMIHVKWKRGKKNSHLANMWWCGLQNKLEKGERGLNMYRGGGGGWRNGPGMSVLSISLALGSCSLKCWHCNKSSSLMVHSALNLFQTDHLSSREGCSVQGSESNTLTLQWFVLILSRFLIISLYKSVEMSIYSKSRPSIMVSQMLCKYKMYMCQYVRTWVSRS